MTPKTKNRTQPSPTATTQPLPETIIPETAPARPSTTATTPHEATTCPPAINIQVPPPQRQATVHFTDNGPLPEYPAKTELFIGNVMASYNSEMMQKHIYMKTGTHLALADIEERPTRGTSKAFRVSVPTSKKETILSIWNPDVKAELFNKKRTAGNQHRSGTFRNPIPQSTNRGGVHSYRQDRQPTNKFGRNRWAHNQAHNRRWGNQNNQNRPPQRYQGNRWGANRPNGGDHYQQERRDYQPQQQLNQPPQPRDEQYFQPQQLNQYNQYTQRDIQYRHPQQQYFPPQQQNYHPQQFVQNF